MSGGSLGPALRLADEFFLLAHNQEGTRMRPRLLPVTLGLGAASALLGELMLAGFVGELDGYILAARRVRADPRAVGAAQHEITARVVARIASGPGQSVQHWLGDLRHDAADGIRDRLLDDGVLEETRGRRWWGGSSVDFQAYDQNVALSPESRLYSVLGDHRSRADLQSAILAGLADATGLLGKIQLWDSTIGAVRDRAAALRAELPEPLRSLLSTTETFVGAATLSSRHH